MPKLETTHVVGSEDVERYLVPRSDLVVERAVGPQEFDLESGPFHRYHRDVRVTGPADGDEQTSVRVTETITYRLAVPVWGFLFELAAATGLPPAPSSLGRDAGAATLVGATRPPRRPGDRRAVAALRVLGAGRLPGHAPEPDQHLLQAGLRGQRRRRRGDAGRHPGRRHPGAGHRGAGRPARPALGAHPLGGRRLRAHRHRRAVPRPWPGSASARRWPGRSRPRSPWSSASSRSRRCPPARGRSRCRC